MTTLVIAGGRSSAPWVAAVTTSGALSDRASRVTPPSTQLPVCGKRL